MNYSAIHIQGNIITLEILDKIRNDENYHYQKPKDFGFDKGSTLRDRISSAWSEAKILWELYSRKMEALPEGEYGTSETRKLWMTPFLFELGYDIEPARVEEINGKTFPISHRDAKRNGFPVLIMGYADKLDRKPEGNRLRMSPHALMQEYLNHTGHLYGLVTNGTQIRLLRDSNRLSKLAYLEFDLGKMLEEDLFYEFALMYRVLHASRMPESPDEAEKSIFEFYHQESLDSGARIREKLRTAVKESMETMAKGFLTHPANAHFVEQVRTGNIHAAQFYKLLLRTVYRIIFLATIEERNLVYPRFTKDDAEYESKNRLRNIYLNHYSFERLRNLALSPVYIDPRKHDLWQALLATFRLFEPLGEGEKLGIKPLGGELFGTNSLSLDGIDLYSLRLQNQYMLEILGRLTTFRDERGQLTRVNYRDLDVEELGSVYEALLELQPYFNLDLPTPAFSFTEGSLRKLTGSYYTRHDLVAQLIKTALIPVMEERLKKARTREEKANAILGISVCDPAAGSGHFLLAAARVLGFELAKIRTGEENPGEEPLLEATRDVIESCIYGVDKNPAAVELCRLSLWLVAHNSGKPLTFLEHKIKCGDSLVGVDNLKRLRGGIPEGAFNPLSGDDRAVASAIKKRNRDFLKRKQLSLFSQAETLEAHQQQFAEKYLQLHELKVYTQEDYEKKRREYSRLMRDPQLLKDQTACNLFTYAFFQEYKTGKPEHLYVQSEFLAIFLGSAGSLNARLEAQATAASINYRFFHWPLEFPDIAAKGGFDVVLANPPWEIVELKEIEFFETRAPEIDEAANKAERTKLIAQLATNNPGLYDEYHHELRTFDASRKFMQESGILTLTNSGRLNLYAAFAEKILKSINADGRAGFIVPTGIATDDGNKRFFAHLIEDGQLVSLFDFENRKKIFPSVISLMKFSLVTILGGKTRSEQKFGFFLHDVLDLTDPRRVFALSQQDFLNINPNTRTTPIFRTRQDAELTAKIYSRVPVLINESKNQNPWGVSFKQGLFNMSTDSHLFRTRAQMEQAGFTLMGNRFVKGEEIWLPLYEAKMIWHFDHRFSTFEGASSRSETTETTLLQKQNPAFVAIPWYWVVKEEVDKQTDKKWFLGFRDIARSTDERTSIFSVLSLAAIGNNFPIVKSNKNNQQRTIKFANFNSLILDFFARQKIASAHLNFFYVEQFAVLVPETYPVGMIIMLIPSIVELIYTSWDIKAFADDVWREADEELRAAIRQQWEDNRRATGGHSWQIPDWAPAYPEIDWEPEKNGGCPLPPFKWDEDRRALLRAELDAWYALLYGLERDELRYILDPQEVYGPDFPGETFRVLKEKEIRRHGEYRTRRLVLEAYDRLRPQWDMESHLKRLKAIWEECQRDLSGEKETHKKPTASKPKAKETGVGYGDLFNQ
ncbi:MAG: N-6 DNA methylase [Bacteroidetes bacterium]|nr:N-6 DNA methylase [Bacteroidota bacterium]